MHVQGKQDVIKGHIMNTLDPYWNSFTIYLSSVRHLPYLEQSLNISWEEDSAIAFSINVKGGLASERSGPAFRQVDNSILEGTLETLARRLQALVKGRRCF